MSSRNIGTPPSPRQRSRKSMVESSKVPSYLTVPRRVQWNPIDKKVEKDALKHAQLLSLLRSNFTWAPSASLTSNDWLLRPEVVPDIVDKITESKVHAEQQRAMRENAEGVRKLREGLGKISSHKHPKPWNDSEKISPEVSRRLWRVADPTPNAAPDFNFRSSTPLPKGQLPWKPSEDYPNESSKYLKVSGVPVPKTSQSGRTVNRFQTTDSYQRMVRPIVGNVCESIRSEIESIDDDCATSSVKDRKSLIKKDLAEMNRIWNLVKAQDGKRITLKQVVLGIISMNRWKRIMQSNKPTCHQQPKSSRNSTARSQLFQPSVTTNNSTLASHSQLSGRRF